MISTAQLLWRAAREAAGWGDVEDATIDHLGSATLHDAGVTSVMVATDHAHAPRALAVGRIVLGAYGIRQTPLLVAAPAAPESWLRFIRDVMRALLWTVTGVDGQTLAALIHPRRHAGVTSWTAGGDRGSELARQLAAALAGKPRASVG